MYYGEFENRECQCDKYEVLKIPLTLHGKVNFYVIHQVKVLI